MSAIDETAAQALAHASNTESDRAQLEVAHMLLRKIRDELDGVRPEDPLDLDAISFFVDEATSRVRSVEHHQIERAQTWRNQSAFLDGLAAGQRERLRDEKAKKAGRR